jgi:hypothetical protein
MPSYRLVSFHAQQAAEKSPKALLIRHQVDFGKTHNLGELLQLADAWINDWNRLRRGKAAVNRIEVLELRTDPKYGKFFQHQPARARVKAVRKNDRTIVEIEDFISPSIIERL